jgi:hypothetical protein
VVYLHLSVLPDALNAQFGKFASPHCPFEGTMIIRAVAGGLADATPKAPALACTLNLMRPGEAADWSRMITL